MLIQVIIYLKLKFTGKPLTNFLLTSYNKVIVILLIKFTEQWQYTNVIFLSFVSLKIVAYLIPWFKMSENQAFRNMR